MYKAISFFSNAGIGDMGVETAGVRIKFANELLSERAKTYKLNHKHTEVIVGDINKIDENQLRKMKDIKDLFMVIATPPCQGVSSAGRRDKFDIRNQLIKPTIKMIKELKPLWIWMENVPRYDEATIPDTENIILDDDSYNRITIIDFIKKNLSPLGYDIETKVVDAKDYGVPQSRKRLIFIMTRTGKKITFPEKTHGLDLNLKPYKTVRDAIGYLTPLESGEYSKIDNLHYAKIHNDKHIKWMKNTPEGYTAFSNDKIEYRPHTIDKVTGKIREIKAFKTTYKRIWWDRPSPTITMSSGSISSQNNVHPRDSRALTVRETMLLQSIPENFKFPENATDKEMREMVGEAVPCLLAEVITKHIMKLHNKGVRK
jgi:DNA (cytosine-5)-methyltransferase 1